MGSTVLVTGATGKTGRRLIPLLLERGLTIRAASRTSVPERDGVEPVHFDWLDETSHQTALDGVDAVYAISDPSSWSNRTFEAFLERATGGSRRVVLRLTPLETLDEATYDELFDVNVKGQLFTLKTILPLLGPGSSVVFNSSTAARRGVPGQSVYSAAKGAVNSLVRSLAVELASRGIRVNAVSPGPVDTPALGKLGMPGHQLEAFKNQIVSLLPTGRFGSDEEIARTVAFLASPAASFITGANVDVDGGMAAQFGSRASV